MITATSTRDWGDMRRSENKKRFFGSLGIAFKKVISLKQVHGNTILPVREAESRRIGDGLVTEAKGLFLTVVTADCIPMFFSEKKKGIVGIAHAGRRGTIAGISQQMIAAIGELGGNVEDIYVHLGPHIKSCCYEIDLTALNKKQLMQKGVPPLNITSSVFCTSCDNNTYFSYRKDSKETFGEMISVVGMK